MKKPLLSFFHRPASSHAKRSRTAQGMLEFALALPILLLLIFGIIEFGRLLQAYLALENGSRFAVRYAVTGNYDVQYCDAAALALVKNGAALQDYPGGYTALHTADIANNPIDHKPDCILPETTGDWTDSAGNKHDWQYTTSVLQDWARLPSIRDVALAGAAGIDWSQKPAVSGDYLGYLSNPVSAFNQLYRGNPSAAGYFNVMTCSNSVGYGIDNVPPAIYYYYNNDQSSNNNAFPNVCRFSASGVTAYMDNGGQPSDVVRVVLTYRHTLITPFLSTWWPTLRLTATREGKVEDFRASRVTGLTGGMSIVPTLTFTPIPPTSTATLPPPTVCNGTHDVLLEYFDNLNSNTTGALSELNAAQAPNYPVNPSSAIYPSSFINPNKNRADHYATRIRGYVCPPYAGNYKFYIASDDASQFSMSTSSDPTAAHVIASLGTYVTYTSNSSMFLVNGSQASTDQYLNAGPNMWYYIEAVSIDGNGSDHLEVAWSGPGIGDGVTPQIIDGQYLKRADQIIATPVVCTEPDRGMLRQDWTSLGSGGLDTALLGDAGYPNDPDEQGKVADFYYSRSGDVNYGTRLQAYLCPNYTGQYYFWLSSDDYGRLSLSGDTNPLHKTAIIDNPSARSTNAPLTLTPGPAGPFNLVAGNKYYIEGLLKQNSGAGFIEGYWMGPFNNIPARIPNQNLIPLTPLPTRTPTYTPTPNCSSVVFDSEGLYLQDKTTSPKAYYIDVHVNNTSLNYPLTLTGVDGSWTANWHTPIDTRPAKSLLDYTWFSWTSSATSPIYTMPSPIK